LYLGITFDLGDRGEMTQEALEWKGRRSHWAREGEGEGLSPTVWGIEATA